MNNEPVAWHYPGGKADQCTTDKAYAEKEPAWTPMYYKPDWVGLTDAEITEIRLKTFDAVATNYEVYQAIEAKLKEKNNG